MSFSVPSTTPANARQTDYPTNGILGVNAGATNTFYTVDDLFSAGVPAALGATLFTGPVVLSPKFMGVHCLASEVSFGPISTGRTHDQAPQWKSQHTASGIFADAGMAAWLSATKASGADTVVTIFGTPTWASARPAEGADAYGTAGGKAEPANMADLSNYVTWLMTNYGSQIDYLEVWNEPKYSYTIGGSYFSGTPSKLAEMARTINLSAKAVKPSVKIMGVGATGVTFTDGFAAGVSNSGVDITNYFLSASDNNGGFGRQWIDILSVHTYDHSGTNNIANLTAVKGFLDTIKASNSISAMPVWSSEFGYITPSFVNYTGASVARMASIVRFVLMHVVMGMDRCIFYSYGSSGMGWQKDPACNAEWSRWASIINGSTVTRINRAAPNGQLACVINGVNYLI